MTTPRPRTSARRRLFVLLALAFALAASTGAFAQTVTESPGMQPLPEQAPHPAAQPAHTPGGEVNLHLPSLEQGSFFGLKGHQLLLGGFAVTFLGLFFGLWTYLGVKKLAVHR